ncbi:MAG: hypothetical protein FRX49_12460 [Trebouxia sp. A1-2]|nr:MAG: hypothetical protein FRX49_12460 [Trebouxia sp. A1-2]
MRKAQGLRRGLHIAAFKPPLITILVSHSPGFSPLYDPNASFGLSQSQALAKCEDAAKAKREDALKAKREDAAGQHSAFRQCRAHGWFVLVGTADSAGGLPHNIRQALPSCQQGRPCVETERRLPAQQKVLLLEEACDCVLTVGLSAEIPLKVRLSVPAGDTVNFYNLFTRAA